MPGLHDILDQWMKGELEPAPVTTLIGIRLLEAGDGAARMELKTSRQHYNPMQTVHGGIFCDLADAAMGVAMASAVQDGETFTTIELNIHYFRAVRENTLTATARVVQRGQSTAYVECDLFDEQQRLVARASSRCVVIPAPPS